MKLVGETSLFGKLEKDEQSCLVNKRKTLLKY